LNRSKRTLLIRKIALSIGEGGIMPSFALYSTRDVRAAAREIGCAPPRGHGHSNRNRNNKQQKKYRAVRIGDA